MMHGILPDRAGVGPPTGSPSIFEVRVASAFQNREHIADLCLDCIRHPIVSSMGLEIQAGCLGGSKTTVPR